MRRSQVQRRAQVLRGRGMTDREIKARINHEIAVHKKADVVPPGPTLEDKIMESRRAFHTANGRGEEES